ncbi:MAG: phosphoadenosine phosphosulfate reductase family protein [Flavonifractor plautii]
MGALITAKENFHAVSLSGGKDSTCLLLLMIERGLPIDAVIWADTGMEFPEMYGHISKVDEHLYRERGYTSPPCALPRASST